MAVNETIVTGRKFRKLIDAANKQWQRISFWHKASDCEFDDGDTAETKVGAIKGITTDLNTTTTGYAADMTTVASLNSSLGAVVSNIYVGSDGKLHKVVGGADTALNFNSNVTIKLTVYTKIENGLGSKIAEDNRTIYLYVKDGTITYDKNTTTSSYMGGSGVGWINASIKSIEIIS